MSTGAGGMALAMAAAVRSGERSARSVVEEHLAVIAGREDEIHAFNLVAGDAALERADLLDRSIGAGDDPGPLAGQVAAMQAAGAPARWPVFRWP